jgi:23S rRNA (guanosine2251-2'-O)-methyltransferase
MEHNYIYGRKPVLEALRNKPSTLEKIYLRYGLQGKEIENILITAKKERIPISIIDKVKFRKIEKEINAEQTQGVVAYLSIVTYLSLEELLSKALKETSNPILVFLDKIQDPHNLGAIARTAECAGATGLIITCKDTAPITATVVKASAGAILHIPISKISSQAKAIELLKDAGFWIVGTSPSAKVDFWHSKYDFPMVLLIGSEGKGVSPSLLNKCDLIVKIPLFGKVESLNASVSSGIILYEIRRQRETSGL